MKKSRSDAILKNLPEERQEQIIAWCQKANAKDESGKLIPGTGGLQYARAQLAADGISIGLHALSDFYSWWRLKQVFERANQKTQDFIELMRERFPDLAPARIQEFGQSYFTLEAAASGNAEEFRAMEKLRLEKETALTKGKLESKKLELAERKVKLLEKKAAEAVKAVEDSKLTESQKVERIREIFRK